jgi:hypothetical protein
MQGCFNGNALDWDQQFWSDIGNCPIYRVMCCAIGPLEPNITLATPWLMSFGDIHWTNSMFILFNYLLIVDFITFSGFSCVAVYALRSVN